MEIICWGCNGTHTKKKRGVVSVEFPGGAIVDFDIEAFECLDCGEELMATEEMERLAVRVRKTERGLEG